MASPPPGEQSSERRCDHATRQARCYLRKKFREFREGEHWKTCVPLVSLRAAVGAWSEH
jgi:hypothetical protein